MSTDAKKPSPKSEEKQVIQVLARPDVQKGVYSNLALIHHTKNEFIVDFLLQFGGEAQLVSRIILSPEHVKAFEQALKDNIQKYEGQFQERHNKPRKVSSRKS